MGFANQQINKFYITVDFLLIIVSLHYSDLDRPFLGYYNQVIFIYKYINLAPTLPQQFLYKEVVLLGQ